MNTADQIVLVTGGTGYFASWMIVSLLEQGYVVRSTVRSETSAEALRELVARQGLPTNRLTLCIADLLQDGGWLAAAEGCHAVMHIASPMGQGQGRKVDLITPAREGTLRVLRAAEQAGVQRVIVTSSAIAAQSADGQTIADETVWTDTRPKSTSNYARSKTLAERAAWDYMQAQPRRFSLTTILPGMILGPVLRGPVTGSVELISRMLGGRMPALPRIGFSIVDVRDLAQLHILALQSPAAAGERFLAVSDFLWLTDIASALRKTLGTEAAGCAAKTPAGLDVARGGFVSGRCAFYGAAAGPGGPPHGQ